MPNYTADQLNKISTRIFQAAGVPETVARHVSASLIESNLVGHDSHGVQMIPHYLRYLADGRLVPQAEIEVVQDTPTTALLDAHSSFGQVAAEKGMAIAIEKAREHHLGAVGIAHAAHIGRLGEYALTAAEQGFIGIVTCNVGAFVAPFGGIARTLGTNPIACAVPAGRRRPFLLDFATSVRAAGKIEVAGDKGERVPEGWILDKEGNPTTDPAELSDGGAMLPFGEYKGYALGLLADIMGGVLTGHSCPSLPEFGWGNGVLMIAIDINTFRPLAEFTDTMDRLFEAIKAGPLARGFSEILIPGEPEFRTKEARLKNGIDVPEKTWEKIERWADQLGVDVQQALLE